MGKNTGWVGSGIEMGVSMFLVPVSEKEDEKMRCDSEILTSCGCESFWFAQAPIFLSYQEFKCRWVERQGSDAGRCSVIVIT